MINFDNAATGGSKPYSVRESVANVVANLPVNATRSGHKLASAGGDIVYKTRKILANLFNAPYPERVIFTKNCTEALNIALLGTLVPGDHVVTTALEHNSVLRPLEHLRATGVEISVAVPPKGAYISQNPLITYNDIRPLVKKNTRLVAVTGMSNVTGSIVDVSGIGRGLKRDFKDIIFLVDGAQSVGHIPINMQKDCIDILCLAGHKGLDGITGSGALIFGDVEIRPLMFGGTGSDSFSLAQPEFYPDRLESGTLSLPAVVSMYEGAMHVGRTLALSAERLADMSSVLISALGEIDGVRVFSLPNPAGIVAFSVGEIPSEEVAAELSDRYDCCVRGGFHCAPLMHEYLGTTERGLVRASMGPRNTYREIDEFVRAVAAVAKS